MTVKNIDLNRASAEEIVRANIQHMSPDRVRDLIEYREENGPFESWDEVKTVPGFNQQMVDDLLEAGVILGQEEDEDLEDLET